MDRFIDNLLSGWLFYPLAALVLVSTIISFYKSLFFIAWKKKKKNSSKQTSNESDNDPK